MPKENVIRERRNHARTTIILPATLDENLDAIRLHKFNGISKNALIIIALREEVKQRGLDPDRHPIIKISY